MSVAPLVQFAVTFYPIHPSRILSYLLRFPRLMECVFAAQVIALFCPVCSPSLFYCTKKHVSLSLWHHFVTIFPVLDLRLKSTQHSQSTRKFPFSVLLYGQSFGGCHLHAISFFAPSLASSSAFAFPHCSKLAHGGSRCICG